MMKLTYHSKIFLSVLLISVSLLLVSCGGDNSDTSSEPIVSDRTVTEKPDAGQPAQDQPAMVVDAVDQAGDATSDTDTSSTKTVRGNEESLSVPDDEITEDKSSKSESASTDSPETDSSATDDSKTESAENETVQNETAQNNSGSAFYISEITDDIFARIKGKSFKDDCTLSRDDLRYLHVLHKDKDGVTHEGEMIVNYHIAEDVLEILKELYENDYPIEKIRLVDEYGADDELSMEDNNSSSFNFRFISHTTKVSKHGLGLAVDINTLYNPYTKMVDGKRIIEPVTGGPYLDRGADFDYKIEKGDLCYNLFTAHGFEWGGNWSDRKDYQHFEIPTSKVNQWYP